MLRETEIHPSWCRCTGCHPYVPADRRPADDLRARFTAAALIALLTAAAIAALLA